MIPKECLSAHTTRIIRRISKTATTPLRKTSLQRSLMMSMDCAQSMMA